MDFYVERGLARDMWISVISCVDSQARKEKKRKEKERGLARELPFLCPCQDD